MHSPCCLRSASKFNRFEARQWRAERQLRPSQSEWQMQKQREKQKERRKGEGKKGG